MNSHKLPVFRRFLGATSAKSMGLAPHNAFVMHDSCSLGA